MTVDQSTQDKPANGSESAPASAPATKLRVPEYRRRTHLTMTVHPDTLSRLKVLTDRYRLPVGQIVNKLVAGLARTHGEDGKPAGMVCINGEACRMLRKDVPEVL